MTALRHFRTSSIGAPNLRVTPRASRCPRCIRLLLRAILPTETLKSVLRKTTYLMTNACLPPPTATDTCPLLPSSECRRRPPPTKRTTLPSLSTVKILLAALRPELETRPSHRAKRPPIRTLPPLPANTFSFLRETRRRATSPLCLTQSVLPALRRCPQTRTTRRETLFSLPRGKVDRTVTLTGLPWLVCTVNLWSRSTEAFSPPANPQKTTTSNKEITMANYRQRGLVPRPPTKSIPHGNVDWITQLLQCAVEQKQGSLAALEAWCILNLPFLPKVSRILGWLWRPLRPTLRAPQSLQTIPFRKLTSAICKLPNVRLWTHPLAALLTVGSLPSRLHSWSPQLRNRAPSSLIPHLSLCRHRQVTK